MYTKAKELFDDICTDVVFDRKLVDLVHQMQSGFVNRNQDHIEFFGGNLTGANIVRFTDADRYRWFDEVLECDEQTLTDSIVDLPGIDRNHKVSGDTFNLSCVWVLHGFATSKKLSEKERLKGMEAVAMYLQFRFLTSRLYRHFRYPCSKEVAQATYAAMSSKFLIKQYGSWLGLLEAKSKEMCSSRSIHHKTIQEMFNDAKVVYLLNDTQGRIRDLLKNIYGLHLKIAEEGSRIHSTSASLELDGESILKEKTKGLENYTHYMHSLLSDKNNFVKNELLNVVCDALPTVSPSTLESTLVWCSDSSQFTSEKLPQQLITKCLVHSFNYIDSNKGLIRNKVDIAAFLSKLKNIYTGSKSTDPEILELRKLGETIVKKATGIKNQVSLSATRTGLLLYIVLRAYTMKHFTSR